MALQVPKFQHLGHLHLWSTAGCAEPVETCRVLCHNRSLRNPRGCARIPFRWPTRWWALGWGPSGPWFQFLQGFRIEWRHEFQEWFEDRGCCWRVWKRSSLSPFRQASSGSQRMQALVLWVWSASFNGHFRLEALYCMMWQLCRLWRWCQRRSRPYIYLLWPWPTVARGNDSRTHVQSARNHEKPRG